MVCVTVVSLSDLMSLVKSPDMMQSCAAALVAQGRDTCLENPCIVPPLNILSILFRLEQRLPRGEKLHQYGVDFGF